jgi:hypothetical protein
MIPERTSVGAALSVAVAAEPENVSFQTASADAERVLRCSFCGAGAPGDVAEIVAATPLGHVDPVTRENVPAIPFAAGTVRLLLLLGMTAVETVVALGLGDGVRAPALGSEFAEPPPPPPQPATKLAARTNSTPQRKVRVVLTGMPHMDGQFAARLPPSG